MQENNKSYDLKRLLSYAEWYTLKYLPSINKLRQKLESKSDNPEDINKIIDKISKFIDEDYLIKEYIRSGIIAWKNSNTLRNNLLNKLFNKDLVNKILLENNDEFNDIDNYEKHIISNLNKFKNKWKSKQASINSVNIKYYNFRETINNLADNIFKEEDESKAIITLIQKFKANKIDNNKIITRLLSRGFKYDSIKIYLD